MPPLALLGLLAAAVVTLVAVWRDWSPLLRGPAPYPPEWRWWLREEPLSGRWLPLVVPVAAWLLLLASTATAWARRRARLASRLVVAGGVLAAWGLSLGLLAQHPAGALRTLQAHTLSRTINSYYAVAISPLARDPRDFLTRHAELLPSLRKTAKHAATHPPGPVLFYRGLIELCERWPRLTSWTLAAAEIESVERPDSPHTPASRAAAILGGLLLGLLAAATAWPTAALARRLGCDALAAARVGLVSGLIPGSLLFTPLLDPALALPVGLTTALLCAALARATSPATAALQAALAGAVAGVALSVSYGAAAFLALGALAALGSGEPGTRWRRALGTGTWFALGALAVLAVPLAFGHETLAAAQTALAIHREVYTAPRSYGLWLLFNPLDLALFLGAPLALLAAARSSLGLELALRKGLGALAAADRFRLTLAGGFVLFLLSGTLRGEGGRLLVPLMPFFALAGLVSGNQARDEPGPVLAAVLGLSLAAVALVLRWHWQV